MSSPDSELKPKPYEEDPRIDPTTPDEIILEESHRKLALLALHKEAKHHHQENAEEALKEELP